jgi:hypothetical protein
MVHQVSIVTFNQFFSFLAHVQCADLYWYFVGNVSSYPFDVMKSVVQTRPDNCDPSHLTMRYVVKEGLSQYGWRFFTRGLGTCLIYAIPVNATTFFIYERIQQQLDKWD